MNKIIDYNKLNSIEKQEYISDKAFKFIRELSGKVLEREELSSLITLAIFSSQNMFLIGKPGVGKTKLLLLALGAVEDTDSFEHLMMYDTKTEAIFGTSVVTSDGNIIHNYKGTVVDSHYVLIDEFFKGSSEIINGFLGIASENRTYHPGGKEPIIVPLRSLFAASNEFHESEALDAMNDRLPIRYVVERIQTDDNFYAMIEDNFDTSSQFKTKISLEMVDYVSTVGILSVSIPREITIKYTELKKKLIIEEEIEASDRRLKGASTIMKASAFLNNRSEVDESDFFLLNHIIWNDYDEKRRAEEGIYRYLFSSHSLVKKYLLNAQENFNKIEAQKQAYLDDFLMKRKQISINDLDDYYLENMYNLDMLINSLSNAYVDVDEIYKIKSYNQKVHFLVQQNIFILNQEDKVFIDDFNNKLEQCNNNYKSLYTYLDNFKQKCPNVRAYGTYAGE